MLNLQTRGPGSSLPNLVYRERLLVSILAESVAEPFQTLIETVTRGGAGRLDVPGAIPEAMEAQLISDLGSIHGVRKILLVGKHQKQSIPQLVFVEHALKLFASLDHTVTIVAIDNEDDALGVLEVVSPERSDLVLSTHIPHGKLDVLVFHSFDIKADGRNGGDDFTQLELIQDGGLSGGIETDHQNAHLLLPP